MSDRINLTRLRGRTEGTDNPNHQICLPCRDVLALVEAVEAAQAHVISCRDRRPSEWPRLLNALARFSFGNTYTAEDHASSQAARRYENHLEQIKDHGP